MRPRHRYRLCLFLPCVLCLIALYSLYGDIRTNRSCFCSTCLEQFTEQITTTRASSLNVQRHASRSWAQISDNISITTLKHSVTIETIFDDLVSDSNEEIDEQCFLPALVANRTFHAVGSSVFVYSAYLDERYTSPIIRIMSVLVYRTYKSLPNVFCHFKNSQGALLTIEAKFYEFSENHGRKFGGFILSCDVPESIAVVDICYINITIEAKPAETYQAETTNSIVLQVTRLQTPALLAENLRASTSDEEISTREHVFHSNETIYNYTVCVPPLFGSINVSHFVEFIELNRMLGFQHFIFYVMDIKSQDMVKILEYYKDLGVVSLIYWKLPDVVKKNDIWYNGQAIVHNDCLYRAISISKYLAIMDIDEFMVPHNGQKLLTSAVEHMLNDSVCGLSFQSAFYDERYAAKADNNSDSKLLTIKLNGRSAMFSKVRTKVLIQPNKVFDVGIHHVSKPVLDSYKVVTVDNSVAFLHHYRNCSSKYHMRCSASIIDNSMLKYSDELLERLDNVINNVMQ